MNSTDTVFSAQRHYGKDVKCAFDGGFVSTDGGALLVRDAFKRTGLLERIASCFSDRRHPSYVEFAVTELLGQRIGGLVLGYEDLNDHDRLRHDPLLALAAGRRDIEGLDRLHPEDVGKPLAGKSTLQRVEYASLEARPEQPRYARLVVDLERLQKLLVEEFIAEHKTPPTELWLDLDTTDFPLHGMQEGRHFNAFYDEYCFTPLYIMSGDFPLLSLLRSSAVAPSKDVVQHLRPVITRLRQAWPNVRLVVRADSGFTSDDLMSYCEANNVHFLLGLATNPRLKKIVESDMELVQAESTPGETVAPRAFSSFQYRTLDSWSCEREVVARLEWAGDKPNARFVVTNLDKAGMTADVLYEHGYCQRAIMENHLKEHQLDLFACRMSAHVRSANQMRQLFATFAFLIIRFIRRNMLAQTPLSNATTSTIRSRLLKVGAILRVSVRRIVISLSSAFPMHDVFRQALADPVGLPVTQ